MDAQLYFNYGVELAHKGDCIQALDFFHKAIFLKPDYAEAYNGLGALLINMNNLNEAEPYLHRAIELKADYPEALYNLGTLLSRSNLLEEAEICLRETINLKSDFAEAHFRLGMIFKQMNRLEAAEAHLCRAIELRPNFREADFALGILYLLQGQYAKGWKKYELRRQLFDFCDAEVDCWQIENLVGHSILLFHEQGFGDTIHFIRYAQKIAKVASSTALLIPKELERLMSFSLENVTIQSGKMAVEEYDFSCPLPSLPFKFNTTLHTIPKTIPYIKTSHQITKKWYNILEKITRGNKYKIGVVWAGNPNHKNDKNRSIPFIIFKQIFAMNGVSWISLQVDNRGNDLQIISDIVTDFREDISDFADTAGLIENLDLIITVDTALAHLAGAMGKETWLLLPIEPDWRWQKAGQESCWYPTIRIFRQCHIGDWGGVLERVKVALQIKLTARAF